ncbi:MAG: hypothetical protein HOP31_02295 [Ignavibacteria bacterium]|nr:hypothetical protein [Ignavibacteria bacterium]
MKTILIFIIFSSAFLLLNSCGDDSTTNNNIPGCTKTQNLISPINDTVFYLPSNQSIKFIWNKATCEPVKYIFQVVAEDTTHNGQFACDNQTTQTGNDTIMFNQGCYDTIPNFWRVKAIYENPADTAYSQWRKFIKYIVN